MSIQFQLRPTPTGYEVVHIAATGTDIEEGAAIVRALNEWERRHLEPCDVAAIACLERVCAESAEVEYV